MRFVGKLVRAWFWLRVRMPQVEAWAFPRRLWGGPGEYLGDYGWEKRWRLWLGSPSTYVYSYDAGGYWRAKIIFEVTWRTPLAPSRRWGRYG